MGDGLEDMYLGPQEGELPLIKNKECIDPCKNEGKQDRNLAYDDNIPNAYGPYADMAVMYIPDYPNDQHDKPGNLNNDKEKDGRPPLGLFHDCTLIPLEA
jgi:hypothetical protein